MDKQAQLKRLLKRATLEKGGLRAILDEIERISGDVEGLKQVEKLIKGKDGFTPKKGVDYFTAAEIAKIIEYVTPVKGRDYFDGERGEDGKTPLKGIDFWTPKDIKDLGDSLKDALVPRKGVDYFTPQEVKEFKEAATPIKGVDYQDGSSITKENFIEILGQMTPEEAGRFSKTVGPLLDIGSLRNAQSFIFNRKKYKVEELMHGGGSSSGGGSVDSVTGTANRIDVNNTDPANPVVNISTSYVGQATITTLGTISTGVWNGTTIGVGFGGTGQSTYTDGQLLIGNSVGNTLTKATITAGSGISVTNGNGSITIAATGGSGTVTSVSVVSANGFAGSVANATTTPAITISTTVTGVLKGNGTAISAAVANTDYQIPIALTTTGTSGAATFDGTTLNIPQYQAAGTYVTAVTGTANRITSSGGTTPAIDIAATYVGQASITTLGTIATGVWNGTVVAGQYGGTGVANTGKTITVSGNTTIGSNTDTVAFVTTGNTSVTLPTSGTLATTTYVPTAITVANEGTDTTCFPLFVTAATGDLGPKTNAALIFNSNTGAFGATTFLANGVAVPTISSTSTLTNKRVTRRLVSVNAPGATPTTNTDNVDIAEFTGLATAITSMTTNLSGTPVNGDMVEFIFLDDGTARGITWGSSFANGGLVNLPTTTVISTVLRVLVQWQSIASLNKWVCIAVA